MADTANKQLSEEPKDLDQSYEYSVINATFDANSDYYPKQDEAEANKPVETLGLINNAFNNDYIQVNIKKDQELNAAAKRISSSPEKLSPHSVQSAASVANPVVRIVSPVRQAVTRIITGAEMSLNKPTPVVVTPIKCDLDKLPPQIEISMYGSETLPEMGLDLSCDKTPLTTLECKGRHRSKMKNR